jgi:hypothetical protein
MVSPERTCSKKCQGQAGQAHFAARQSALLHMQACGQHHACQQRRQSRAMKKRAHQASAKHGEGKLKKSVLEDRAQPRL